MILRSSYLLKEVSHEEYYGQFVTERIKDGVKAQIGLAKILASSDPVFADIPLRTWDGLYNFILLLAGKAIAKANKGGISLSDTVCIAKEAARQIRKEHKP